MSPASRASATSCFELKSAALTLIAVVVKTADLALLASALRERLGDAPGMFEHDPVVIDITQLRDVEAPIAFAALAALLREHRMVPVAVKGGSAAQMAAALAAGLAEAPEGLAPARAPQPAVTSTAAGEAANTSTLAAAHAGAGDSGSESGDGSSHTPAEAASSSAGAGAQARAHDTVPTNPTIHETRVIDRPLRSGQQVYARNADLVVMAVVSHGAEVIADGHIHVYGPLRGRAIAGAKGNTQARIFTTCMEPQLVSIAGTYRTTETELPANVLGKPAQVRLDGDRLVIEPLDG